MTGAPTGFRDVHRRPRWWLVALIVLGHIVAVYGLIRIFAPDAVASVEDSVRATFNFTIDVPPPPEVAAEQADEGAAGEAGREAIAKSVAAPEPRVPVASPSPMPRASSTGTARSSGARDSGEGTGASGSGAGTGSGGAGGGRGGGVATKAVQTAGNITDADVALFPIPPGGRSARYGQQVTIRFTIGADGRVSNCRIAQPSNDPVADRLVCRLAQERFRFRPALDADGRPVSSEYGWRQRFYQRD